MTEEFGFDAQQRKNWFFRIRREERELEKQQALHKKIMAKKKLKKLIKRIPEMKQLRNFFTITFRFN